MSKYSVLKYPLSTSPGEYAFRFPKGSKFLSAQTQHSTDGMGRVYDRPVFWMQVPHEDEESESERRVFKVVFTGGERTVGETDRYLCTLQCDGLVLHIYEVVQ